MEEEKRELTRSQIERAFKNNFFSSGCFDVVKNDFLKELGFTVED